VGAAYQPPDPGYGYPSGSGIIIYLWSGTSGWKLAGSNSAYLTNAAAARTITASPSPPLSQWVSSGQVWLLARPQYAQANPGYPGQLSTDYVEVQATYTLP